MNIPADIRKQRVLDLGCGDGTFLRGLRGQGAEGLIGLDMDMRRVLAYRAKHCDASSHESIHFVNANAHILPFAAESFDFVVCAVTLYQLDRRTILPEIHRILRPGGQFVFTDHTLWYLVQRCISSEGQSKSSSRLRSIAGMLLIFFNGILYNYLGINPLLRRLRYDMGFIFQSRTALRNDLERAGFELVDEQPEKRWLRHPIVLQWIAQRKGSPK